MKQVTYALDFETYYDKECSIKTHGPIGYFAHPHFDAYMVSVVGDDGYSFVGHPKDFDWSLLAGNIVLSHNAGFDHTLYLYGVDQNWWSKVDYAEWHCTADMCAAVGLPRSLKNASAAAFGLEVSKDTRDNMKGKRWESMDADFKNEVERYALKDSELCLRLWQEWSDKWSDTEKAISKMNREISQRGVPINHDKLKYSRETIKEKLFEAESAIPWNGERPLLSRKAFDEECIKHGIEPPASLAQTDQEAQKWIEKHSKKLHWVRSVTDWRRINSIAKKLDSFDKATMSDGRFYGGIKYYGGHTGRFSGGGSNLNLQNLPRDEMFGVNMRHIIEAPKGRKLVVVDLSQIEVRTLCWLANDFDTLKEIEASDDIYEAFAIRFGLWSRDKGVLKDVDPSLRHKVKGMVLGCFGPETEVLTGRGWVPIVSVVDTDILWDGQKWVNHQGLINRGTKEVIVNHGVVATPCHEILTEHGWREWGEVQQSEKDLKSALRIANLPSSHTNIHQGHVGKADGIRLSNAPAGGLGKLIGTTFRAVKHLGATLAPRRKQLGHIWNGVGMPQYCQIMTTEKDFLTEYLPSIIGVSTRMTKHTQITGGGVFGFMNRGFTTDLHSSNTSSLLKAGINLISNLTGWTTKRGMNRETSDLLRGQKTAGTSDAREKCRNESKSLRTRSEVYDIALSGPNNRYTIKTDKGPLIVHNCGYGSGPSTFAAITNMPMAEAEKSVQLYRSKLRKIPELWRSLNNRIAASHTTKTPMIYPLPSGNDMHYGIIKQIRFKNKAQYVALVERNGKKMPMKLWGGVVAENLSQRLARDIFCHHMLEIDKSGEEIILHVHDEVVVECDEDRAQEVLDKITKIMSTPPPWIPDIPLSSEGQILDKYQK